MESFVNLHVTDDLDYQSPDRSPGLSNGVGKLNMVQSLGSDKRMLHWWTLGTAANHLSQSGQARLTSAEGNKTFSPFTMAFSSCVHFIDTWKKKAPRKLPSPTF